MATVAGRQKSNKGVSFFVSLELLVFEKNCTEILSMRSSLLFLSADSMFSRVIKTKMLSDLETADWGSVADGEKEAAEIFFFFQNFISVDVVG